VDHASKRRRVACGAAVAAIEAREYHFAPSGCSRSGVFATMTIKTTMTAVVGTTIMTVVLAAQSAPARLGLTERQAQDALLQSLEDGGLYVGSSAAKAFVALPPSARAALIDAGFAWTKAYVNSAAFKTAYLHSRDERKPAPPSFEGSVDDEVKRKQDEQAKSLADSRAALAALPADQRAQLEAVFKASEAQMKDPQMIALMRQSVEMQRTRAQQDYQTSLERWQKSLPADPNALVARRLRSFINLSASVDFDAKLQGTGTERTFVNEDYQSKPSDWKMCFRAGKDAVAAARADATNWLKELPQ
jgi:hypothetical protein